MATSGSMLHVIGESGMRKHTCTVLADSREQWLGSGHDTSIYAILDKLYKAKHKPEHLCKALQFVAAGGEEYGAVAGCVDEVAMCLSHPWPPVQKEACMALQSMGEMGSHYIDLLLPLLTSPEAYVRAAAVDAFGILGPRGDGVVGDTLGAVLQDEDVQVKCATLEASGWMRDFSQVERMVAFLDSKDANLVASACVGIGNLGGEKAEPYADAIAFHLTSEKARPAALGALCALGEKVVAKYVDTIAAECLIDVDASSRQLAILVVGLASHQLSSSTISKIVDLTKSDEPYRRATAALALGHMGAPGLPYVAELVKMLQDDEEDRSWMSLQLGGTVLRQQPTLRKPKCAAVVAMGMLGKMHHDCASNGDWEFTKQITAGLQEDDWEMRYSALEALLEMGPKARVDLADVANMLDDDVYMTRAKACNVLGSYKAVELIDQVADLLHDPCPTVRCASLTAMGAMGEECGDVSGKVYSSLDDPVGSVRAAAVGAIGNLGEYGRPLAGVLVDLLYHDPDFVVRAAVLEALGNLGSEGAAFVDEVGEFLEDDAPEVRVAAVKALGQMGGEAQEYRPMIQALTYDNHPAISSAASDALAKFCV